MESRYIVLFCVILFINTMFAFLIKDSWPVFSKNTAFDKRKKILFLIPPVTLVFVLGWWFKEMGKRFLKYFEE